MKSSKTSNVIGIISTILLGIANVCNLFFTICLLIEQIETGWGFSTNYEMLVLVPWMIEIVCFPVIVLAIVYFILNIFKKSKHGLFVANVVLFSLLLCQYLLTNLFIFN